MKLSVACLCLHVKVNFFVDMVWMFSQLVHGQLCTDAEESSSKSGNKSGRSNLLLRAQAARCVYDYQLDHLVDECVVCGI